MKMKIGITMATTALMAMGAQADSFGTGANAFSLDFVNIGNAGNTADTTGYGAVAESYRMGKFEVTNDQFSKANAATGGTLGNNSSSSGSNLPTQGATWLEAAKFANYLTSGSYNGGAYQFSNSSTFTGVNRAAAISTYGTVYVLPTEDEWHKAAYLKSDGSAYTLYATGNSIPTEGAGGENYNNVNTGTWDVGSGVAENNGTYDMNGNVWEWTEDAFDGTLDVMTENRTLRGGTYYNDAAPNLSSGARTSYSPSTETIEFGFRVVSIPEPSSIAMVGLVSGIGLFIRRKFML